MLTSWHSHGKSREVCIKARSPPASLTVISQVTKHTTVKWPIGTREDLFPHLKVPLDVRYLGMKLNHWNIISAELPTIYDSERFLFLLCKNFNVILCRVDERGRPIFGAKPIAWRHKTFIFSLLLICMICFCDYKSLFLNNECRL